MLSMKKIITSLVIFCVIMSSFLVSSVWASGGAVDDSAICDKASTVLIDVLANDVGLSQIGSISSPQHGTAVIENGKIRYTPDPNWFGIEKFTYTAMDKGLYFEGTGHYYEYVSSPSSTWGHADGNASAKEYYGLKGYLVTIMSKAENDFVTSKLMGSGWMGASDVSSEGHWLWVTGPEAGREFYNDTNKTVLYANWGQGEPNNTSGTEHYGNFIYNNPPFINGTWNDLSNDSGAMIAGYIVEYGGMPNDVPTLPTATVTVVVLNNSKLPIHAELKASYNNRLKTVDSLQSQILKKLPEGCKQNGVSSEGCSVSPNVKTMWNQAEQYIQNAKKTGNVIKAMNDLKKAKEIFEQILSKI